MDRNAKRATRIGVLLAVVTTLTACGSSSSNGSGSTTSSTKVPNTAATTWLCKPGLADDPCAAPLALTSVPATGPSSSTTLPTASGTTDCFYVYPTVSTQSRINATLEIQKAEIDAAASQAAPFSSVCSVYAPVYRQVTIAGLAKGLEVKFGNQAALDTAYADVASGFASFLAAIPKDHRFVLLGHSQGAAMLIRIVRQYVDPDPALRARLVSALLIGGNVTVATGSTVGGAFKNIPLCTSPTQTGCVVAYSSFLETPPTNSFFGIPGRGVSQLWGQTETQGLEVACVDPAQLLGVAPSLTPIFRDKTGAGYLTYPGLYTGGCQHDASDNATWLQVNVQPAPAGGNPRPVVTERLGKVWGTHLDDVNLTQGDLLALVAEQTGQR